MPDISDSAVAKKVEQGYKPLRPDGDQGMHNALWESGRRQASGLRPMSWWKLSLPERLNDNDRMKQRSDSETCKHIDIAVVKHFSSSDSSKSSFKSLRAPPTRTSSVAL
jgi:hypothetical protein